VKRATGDSRMIIVFKLDRYVTYNIEAKPHFFFIASGEEEK